MILAADAPPTVAQPASANPSDVIGKTSALSALGADESGESGPIYFWAATGTPPAAPVFNHNGTNAAKNVTVTFKKAGAYDFTVTITDGESQRVTSSVSVTVEQTLTTIVVTPNNKIVNLGATLQYTALVKDQFATLVVPQPAFAWATHCGGTINAQGLLFATVGRMPVRCAGYQRHGERSGHVQCERAIAL